MWFIPSESDIGPCPFPTSAAAPGAPCSSTIAIDAGYTPTTRILIGVLSALSLILVLELVPWLRVKASCAARARTAPLRVVQIGYALVVTLSGTVVLIDFHGNAGMLHPAVSWVAFNLLLAGGVCWMLLVSLQLIALVQRLERIVLQHPIRRDAGSALLRAARWSCSVVMAASLSVSFGEGFREAAAPVRIVWFSFTTFVFFAFPLAALGVSAVVLLRTQRALAGVRVAMMEREEFRARLRHTALAAGGDGADALGDGDGAHAPPAPQATLPLLPPQQPPHSHSVAALLRSHELALGGIRRACASSLLVVCLCALNAAMLWPNVHQTDPLFVCVWPGYEGVVTPPIRDGLNNAVLLNAITCIVLTSLALFLYGEAVVVMGVLRAACAAVTVAPPTEGEQSAKVQDKPPSPEEHVVTTADNSQGEVCCADRGGAAGQPPAP